MILARTHIIILVEYGSRKVDSLQMSWAAEGSDCSCFRYSLAL
jgi:hypothetical protein